MARRVASSLSPDVIAKMASIRPSSRSRPSTICSIRSWTSSSSSRNRSCDSVSRNGGLPGLTFALSGCVT
ncbi:Uncharacterised protein [Mycobacterium tuberculosis]|nr:Uncharacterised protein [Mycobacterium tuberculosis]